MRFEVPQFIEVEDKIVGPFTWKQFVYIAGAAGIAVVTFLTLPFFLFLLIAGPVAALGGFLAFHEVNNRPFSLFLESFVQYVAGGKLYLWHRGHKQTITGRPAAEPETMTPNTQEGTPATAPGSTKKLSTLSRQLTLNTLESPKPEQ
jgi:hypothetical protein